MWILVGALVGAVAGAAGAIISAKLQGKPIDWTDVGTAAVTGAVTGALATATLGVGLLANPAARTATGAVIGAAASGGDTLISNELHGRPIMQGVESSVVSGAVGGAITGLTLDPAASSLAGALTRTAVAGATGNAAARATDNLLEGRPVLDGVPAAGLTGAITGVAAHGTALAADAALTAVAPRPTITSSTPVSEAAPEIPSPAAPSSDTVPAPPRGPPVTGQAPAQESAIGVSQILEKLEAPDPARASTTGAVAAADATTTTAPTTTAPATTAPASTAPANPVATNPTPATSTPTTAAKNVANQPLGEDEPAVAATQPAPTSPLPNADQAQIDMRKLTDYALNPDHPVGGNKARVFNSALGFTRENAADLAAQIRAGLPNVDAIQKTTDQYGTRYQANIPVTGPKGSGVVTTGWIIRPGSTTPELTTLLVK